jgi:hypothetical protein
MSENVLYSTEGLVCMATQQAGEQKPRRRTYGDPQSWCGSLPNDKKEQAVGEEIVVAVKTKWAQSPQNAFNSHILFTVGGA